MVTTKIGNPNIVDHMFKSDPGIHGAQHLEIQTFDHMFQSNPGTQNTSILFAPKVICTLVYLLFANPQLRWDSPGEHVELFAGCMSVTRAEWEVWGLKR